jgi:ferredoxin
LDIAEKNGIDIPFSCRTGACFACACTIKEGMEHVDLGLLGMPLVDVEDDQCLSCIAGVKKQVFSQPGFHRVVLQKLM